MEYIVAIILALITTSGTIINTIISKSTNKKVDSIQEFRMEYCKTYLTDFLADLNNGVEKNEHQKAMASELYDFYTKNGGNSYIHSEYEKALKKGLI